MDENLVTLIGKPDVKLAGYAAAICTGSNDPEKALKGALDSGHESVIEHLNFTFHINGISRVTLAQLTRHRIASFSVESQRYVDKRGNVTMSIPDSIATNEEAMEAYRACITYAYNTYAHLISKGVPVEDARYVLPESTRVSCIVTMNARELRHFFRLRCCRRAQTEIRTLAIRMRELVMNEAPEIFLNSGPGCYTDGRCPEGKRSCGHPWVK